MLLLIALLVVAGRYLARKFGYQVAVRDAPPHRQKWRNPANGAAQESNLPSRGLHDLTGFEDRPGHRALAAPASSVLAC